MRYNRSIVNFLALIRLSPEAWHCFYLKIRSILNATHYITIFPDRLRFRWIIVSTLCGRTGFRDLLKYRKSFPLLCTCTRSPSYLTSDNIPLGHFRIAISTDVHASAFINSLIDQLSYSRLKLANYNTTILTKLITIIIYLQLFINNHYYFSD